jgi:hypothetical protein
LPREFVAVDDPRLAANGIYVLGQAGDEVVTSPHITDAGR